MLSELPELPLLNRSAVIVLAKEPMLAWLRSVDPTSNELTLADVRSEPSIYLVRECADDAVFAATVRRVFRSIFEQELGGWHTDPNCWPKPLTYRLFQDWFEVNFHSMIVDLCDSPLVREAL